MNLEQLHNNVTILLKPYEGKELNPLQKLAKDTLIGCNNVINDLCELIDKKDEHLAVSSREIIRINIELKKNASNVLKLEKSISILEQENKELTEQNIELKKNITI